jgi:WD40 repeat protein
MKTTRFSRNVPAPATWIAWTLIIILSMTLLAACGGGDNSPAKPGDAAPPTPIPADAEIAAPAVLPTLVLPVKDVRSAAYSPDGSQIALTNGSTVWIYTAGLEQVRALKGHDEAVRWVAWSPDGSQLASASLDGTVRVWDVASGDTVATFTGHADWVVGAAWSPDGTKIVSGGTENALFVWDAATGTEATQLGASRVESIQLQFADDAIFDTISELDYAETLLADVAAEPFTDLVAQLKDLDYTLTIAFDAPAQVAQLMALRDSDVQISITSEDEVLTADLAALPQADLRALALALDDPAVLATIQQLNEAEDTVTAINARDDADLIRAVRSLQNEEVILVIETDDGGTTVASPADENFIATLAAAGDNAAISFGIENQDEIAARLQDPDFLAAVQALDEAQNTIAEITARDDAASLLLIRGLLAVDYTVTLRTGDADLESELAALDNAARIDLLRLLQDTALLDLLTHPDQIIYTAEELRAVSVGDITTTLAPLAYSLALSVDDAALQAELDGLPQEDVLRVAQLLNSPVLRYQIDEAENAQAILDAFAARDDADFILALRQLEAPRTVETIFSVVQGSDDVRISRKRTNEDYVLTVTVRDEAAVLDLIGQSDEEVGATFRALSGDDLNALIDAGTYATTPALDPADIALIMGQINTPMFTVITQREANGHTNSVTAVAWSVHSGLIVSASADMSIRLWDVVSGQLLNTLELDNVIVALAWSPDGTQLVSGDWGNEAIVWDVSAGAENVDDAVTLKGHEERVLAVTWSPDGAYVATGSRDGTVRVWDAVSGDQLALLEGHADEVRAVAWSPDGATLLSAGLDGTVRLWDVAQVLGTE